MTKKTRILNGENTVSDARKIVQLHVKESNWNIL